MPNLHLLTETELKQLGAWYNQMNSSIQEAVDSCYKQINQAAGSGSISEKAFQEHTKSFFLEERNEQFNRKASGFYKLLHASGLALGQAIAILNELHYSYIKVITHKHNLFTSKSNSLMNGLQKAAGLELEMLADEYMSSMMITASEGIVELLDKNSEISYIRELLKKMEYQRSLSHNVAAASEELSASIKEVASNAALAADRTDDAVKYMDRGKQVITKALEEIIHSSVTIDQIMNHFNELREGLEEIENVVEMVDGIANQTHLLALNASIEASRAGEEGRGFAVVATEIRKLAHSTKESLQEAHNQVKRINRFTSDVSVSIESASSVIQKGVSEADEAVSILNSFTDQMINIGTATSSIAAITEEQHASVEEASSQVMEMAEVTDQVSDLANSTGTAVHELSKTTEQFRNSMFTSQTGMPMIALLQLAKSDHILWKWRIYNMLLGYEKVTPEQVTSHHECRLGKWYFDADSMSRFGMKPAFQSLDQPHQKLHQHARAAVEAYAAGHMGLVEEHMLQIEQASKEVVYYIDQLLNAIVDYQNSNGKGFD
ncbi:methyl-accepting chemotaxis protein [Paenibacillus marinisediminis]